MGNCHGEVEGGIVGSTDLTDETTCRKPRYSNNSNNNNNNTTAM